MFRIILIALLGLYLITVGIWPAALAPVSLLIAGLVTVFGAIPGPAWLLAGLVAWLKHRPATATKNA